MNTEAGILICLDDEREAREVTSLLGSIGFTKVVAASGLREAEETVRPGGIRVMVVDTTFGGGGMRFIREERRRAFTSRVDFPKLIVIAGRGDVNEATGLPPEAIVIGRPFTQAELVRQIIEAANSTTKSGDTLPERQPESDDELEVRISEVLHSVGIPAHIKGYTYLRRAIEMNVRDPNVINFVTKTLYPTVALDCETTPTRVERAIRHAIEVAWDRGDVEVLDSYFGYTISRQRGKPTNSEFIAMIADKIRLGVIH